LEGTSTIFYATFRTSKHHVEKLGASSNESFLCQPPCAREVEQDVEQLLLRH